ncbi:hypothetical protein C2E23DRAFT_282619 [Lenzites betulinus]|nr:hypothetical protein C2E23DRAFT_282619 [Lenzites betulinus]
MPIFAPIPLVDWQDLTRPRALPEPDGAFCEELVRYEGQLNETIKAITSAICDLRTLRNSKVSVNRLPPELLLDIFSLLIGTTIPPSSVNVIPITGVCRAWRTLALDAPDLWSSIIAYRQTVNTKLFLERSKDVLLDVCIPHTISQSYPMLDHIHNRIRSLTVLNGNASAVIRIAKQLARGRTPYLKTLQLNAPWPAPSPRRPPIPPALPFYGQDNTVAQLSPMPSLRSLRLSTSCFPWTSNIYCNLSILEVEGLPLDPPTEERVLRILQQCPALTRFALGVGGDLVGARIPAADSAWDVNLPLLSAFALKTVSVACAGSLLSHLILPRTTTFVLTLRSDTTPESSPPYPRLFPSSPDRLPFLNTIDTMLFDGYGYEIAFSLYPSSDPSNPVVALSLAVSDDIPRIPDGMLDMVEIFKANNSLCEWVEWHDVFCCAPRLRSLSFTSPADEDLVRALDDLIRPPTAPNTYPLDVPCPKLESLEFHYVTFTPRLENRLIDAVRERAAMGYPLRSIAMHDCPLDVPRAKSKHRHRGVMNPLVILRERLDELGVNLDCGLVEDSATQSENV